MRGRVKCNNENLGKALKRKGLTREAVSIRSYHSNAWLSGLASRGYLTQEAAEILDKYGIKREEWEAHE